MFVDKLGDFSLSSLYPSLRVFCSNQDWKDTGTVAGTLDCCTQQNQITGQLHLYLIKKGHLKRWVLCQWSSYINRLKLTLI